MMGYLLEQGQNNLFTYREQIPVMCRIVGSELLGMDGIAAGASIAQHALHSLADENPNYAHSAIYEFNLECDFIGTDISVLSTMLEDALAITEARTRQEAAMITNRMLRRFPAFAPDTPRLTHAYPHLMCVGAALAMLLYDQIATRWMCLFVPLILCRAAVNLARNCHINRIGIVQVTAQQVTVVLANNHRMLAHLHYIEACLEMISMQKAQ